MPADSGTGRRVVFSQSRQRVWLVDAKDAVERTYLVSGSVTDNLEPGHLRGLLPLAAGGRRRRLRDDEVLRALHPGPTGAAIGFHDIPTQNGVPVQTAAQLGTPQSHGCIRQRTPDAIALWNFAPVGTKVVVVA